MTQSAVIAYIQEELRKERAEKVEIIEGLREAIRELQSILEDE